MTASPDSKPNTDSPPSMSRFHDSPDNSIRDNAAPVQTTKIEISERTLSIVAIFAATLALGLVIGTHYEVASARFMAERAETQSEVTRQQIMQHDALLVRYGVLKPSDLESGPSNPETPKRK